MLIAKIRQKCSLEFISIIDQVVLSEFDELNDQILENEENVFLIRDSVLAHYRENIETFIKGDLENG